MMPVISLPKLMISSYDSLKNPYYAGGGAIAIHEIAKRLAGKYEVTILTGKYDQLGHEKIDGVRYRQIGIQIHPQLNQLVFQLALLPHVVFDQYHLWLENFTPPVSTSFLPLFTSRPVIGWVHMLSASDMQRKYHLPFPLIENLGLKLYSHLITTSAFFKKHIHSVHSKASIRVISNGINLTKPSTLPGKPQFLFMGRLETNQKGLDLLIQAYTYYRWHASRQVKLVIAGSGTLPQVRQLQSLVAASPFHRDIYYIGRATGNLWHRLYLQSLALVIPSRFETFSLVALEALAHRLPVVCFDLAGLQWLPDSAALKVTPYNIRKLARAMFQVSSDSSLRDRLRTSGYRLAGRLTWDKISHRYDRYLRHLLAYAPGTV